MKKLPIVLSAILMSILMMSGCAQLGIFGSGSTNQQTGQTGSSAAFDAAKGINIISREEGSGTRGAFIELFGVEEKDSAGNKVDKTTQEANITNNTSVMMTTVAGDKYSIGYISLGSLNDTVKALNIGGVAATVANITNGTYPIVRPFYIATKGTVSPQAQDFINYILSADGQAIIKENGYITVSDKPAYSSSKQQGKITVAGSSSVTPVMEKLQEAYIKLNPNMVVEVQQSDSTTGMTSTINGVCNIGMASREVKDSEKEKGLTPTIIAKDGIAVIVNKGNTLDSLTKEQVKSIYTGATTAWQGVQGK